MIGVIGFLLIVLAIASIFVKNIFNKIPLLLSGIIGIVGIVLIASSSLHIRRK